MALSAGTRLGPYEIAASLGAGGMGEVYRARDTRLDRTVAIKVLPANLATDPQFRERFEREARTISRLDHAHICTLYDVGQDGDKAYLVMQHLEGETLEARLSRGPLPLHEALSISIQIAEALDAAHQAGVVHRDFKPGNIMLTKSGAKLLDFGLAKAGGPALAPTSGSLLPTTPANLTVQGTILGTFQYMAPEQLEGEEADARTDIFALGAVLYEMVTGRRAFAGNTQAMLISSIIKDDPPPISSTVALAPSALDFTVSKCLAKDRERRWQSAGDIASQLSWIAQVGAATPPLTLPRAEAAGERVPRRFVRQAAAITVLAAVAAAAAAWVLKPSPVAPRPVSRFTIDLPQGQTFTRTGRPYIAISPDGTKVVYVANQQLYLRTLDQVTPVPIRGSDVDPVNPFFSPDGQWIAFWAPASNELKKIALTGGVPVTICAANNPFGASWSGDRILFAAGAEGIYEVAAAGGTPSQVVKIDPAREQAFGPQLLPGDRVLFTLATDKAWDRARIVVQSMATGRRTVVVDGGMAAMWVDGGHLLFARNHALLAAPFDVANERVTGSAIPLVENVHADPIGITGASQFAVSKTGTLVFVVGASADQRSLVWVDRQGHQSPLAGERKGYAAAAISPDGRRIALEVLEGQNRNIWVLDVSPPRLSRLTSGGSDQSPVWMPDGRRIVYTSDADGARALKIAAADGTGVPEVLARGRAFPFAVLPTGTEVIASIEGGGSPDVGVITLSGTRALRALFSSPEFEQNPAISDDGRWLAYDIGAGSENAAVVVRPYPDVDAGRWQVSSKVASTPRWSRNSKEIYFIDGVAGAVGISAVPYSVEDGVFKAGTAMRLFDFVASTFVNYTVAPDGRFLFITSATAAAQQQIMVVENWGEELNARVPAETR